MQSAIIKVTLYLGVMLGLVSCSINPEPYISLQKPSYSFNRVTLNDALMMASTPTKGSDQVVAIEPFVDEEGDTLMYLVNYDNGWKILSADKRTPVLIAQGDYGTISLSTDNKGLLAWLEFTAADMKHIIHLQDGELNFTADEIASHRQEWAKALWKEPHRFQGDSLPILPLGWQLVGTGTQEVFYDKVNHLVQAHWDQNSPYNYYCPPKDSGAGNKPTGCTAVACGQHLQYLCSVFDIPFVFQWNGLSGDISDVRLNLYEMDDNYTSALLLRYLGATFQANYTDSSTSVSNALSKIKALYNNNGITCSRQSYSPDKVKDNLINAMPVIVSAASSQSGRHTFLIDGYKRTRTMYLEYYERWSGYPPLLEERTDTVGYSSPHIYRIKMNWGWWTQWFWGYDNDWYALTGDWYVHSGESYSSNASILCDFDY